MERREFIKGMAFLSITPFLPNIQVNAESIETASLHWVDKTPSEIVDDIKAAMEALRRSTGYLPDTIMVPESVAKDLGFDVDKIPDETGLDRVHVI